MATNSVAAKLNKGIKLNYNNYDIWYRKVQNLLELQDSLEVITNVMTDHQKVTLLNIKVILKHMKLVK